MNPEQYLKAACKAGAWKRLTWRVGIFVVSIFPDESPEDYDLSYIDGYPNYYLDGKWIPIEGAKSNVAAFLPELPMKILAEDFPGLKSDLDTTMGRYVFNWIVLVFSGLTELGYIEDMVDFSQIGGKIYDRCVISESDETTADKPFKPSNISKFIQALHELQPMSLAIVPTGTIRTVTPHPDIYKVRDALLLKHKDELDKPEVIVKIEEALNALEYEWLAQDQSIEYYKSNKSRKRRSKLLIMYGIESAFKEGNDFTLIPISIAEGSMLTNLVAEWNSIREASYKRGAETAKGGELVRIIQMIFQNHKVVKGDCGTKLTHNVLIDEYNINRYIGMNCVDNGKLINITKDYIKGKVGKFIKIRRPLLCQQGHVDCCSGCASDSKALEERAIAADVAAGQSVIMYNSMAAMHGSETIIVTYIPKLHIN